MFHYGTAAAALLHVPRGWCPVPQAEAAGIERWQVLGGNPVLKDRLTVYLQGGMPRSGR